MRNMTRHKVALTLLSFLLLAAIIAVMPSHPAMAEDKSITMFIPDTDWPPYLVKDPNFPGEGVLVDVLKAAVQPMGYAVDVQRLPNKRGWTLLRSGGVDIHAKAREWVKDAQDYLWSAPFLKNEDVLLYTAENPLQYTSPEALYGKHLAAIQGFVYPALEPHFGPTKIHRVDTPSPYTMLELLARGRVDAALVNRSETLWLFRNHPELKPERFRMDETPCDSASYRYVFTKDDKWKPFIESLNQRLIQMEKDGSLKAILDRYK